MWISAHDHRGPFGLFDDSIAFPDIDKLFLDAQIY